jgi:hypothetical protein
LAADITVRVTVIVYRVTSAGVHVAEIGRATAPDTVLSTATLTLSPSFTTASPVTFNAGDRIQVEAYVTPITLGDPAAPAAAVNVNFVVDETSANNGASFTAIPTYDILYARSLATSGTGSPAANRRITAFRSFPTSMVATSAMARTISAKRAAIVTATGAATRVLQVGISRAATGMGTAALVRRITAARSFATSGVGTAAMARRITAARSFAITAIGGAVYGRALIFARSFARTALGSPSMARRIIAARSFATSTTGSANRILRVGAVRAATAIGTPTMARRITTTRISTVIGVGIAAFDRALIFGRTFVTTVAGVVRTRLDIPETALDRITTGGPTDWSPNNGAKIIAGVVRDSTGTPYAGASVQLIRETDGYVAAATISAADGSYSFTRDTNDPYTYRVLAWEDTGTPTQGMSARGLVPV